MVSQPSLGYCFTLKLFCGSQSSFYCPPPARPTRLQDYCTTIAQYTTPSPAASFVCHTPYNSGKRISCKGQRAMKTPLYYPPTPSLGMANQGLTRGNRSLAFTRYCYCQYCMVHGIQTGSRREGRTMSNSRAMVLHQGGQCRWERGMK